MKVKIDLVRHLRDISRNVTCQINVVWLIFLLLGAITHSIGGIENQNVSKELFIPKFVTVYLVIV